MNSYIRLSKDLKFSAAPTISALKDIYVNKKNLYTEEQFDSLVAADPTYQGTDFVGSYTLWLYMNS